MEKYQDTSDKIIQRICECGWDAYLVGGAVRDIFAGFDPSDYDIVTDATPDELATIFSERKIDTVGANFLVTLVDGIEVSTYRSDKNSKPGRQNCKVEACKTLREDLYRRDFTFNAMAVCPYTGEVIDQFNGREDLDNKIIRFVGNPNIRIEEDYLRMIRAARFACLIEGQLEQNTFEAIRHNREYIYRIAPERIRLELLKVMKYRNPSIFFDILHDTEILDIVLPDLDDMYNHQGGKYHNETLCTHFKLVGDSMSSKDPLLRLIGYLHDIGKVTAWERSDGDNFIDHEKIGRNKIEETFDHYKFSHEEIKRASGIVRFHMRSMSGNIKNKGVRRMLRKFTEHNVNWKDWMKLKIADRKGNNGSPDYTEEEIQRMVLKIHNATKITESGGFKITDLAINGKDIMNELKLRPGPKVGKVLNILLDIVVDRPELNYKDSLVDLLSESKGEVLWDQLLKD